MAKTKVEKVMGEYKHGKLHSGSKHGPKVQSRKQAIAIALSEKRQEKRAGVPMAIAGGLTGAIAPVGMFYGAKLGYNKGKPAFDKKKHEKKASDNRYLNKIAEMVDNKIQKDTKKNIKSAPKANEKFFTRQKMRGV